MASFIGALQKIGHGVNVAVHFVAAEAPVIAPLTNLIPGVGPAINLGLNLASKISGLVVQAETTYPTAGTGAQKQAWVENNFATWFQDWASVMQAAGYDVTYNSADLQAAIQAQVAAFNAIAKVESEVKVTKHVAAPAPTPTPVPVSTTTPVAQVHTASPAVTSAPPAETIAFPVGVTSPAVSIPAPLA